MCAGSLLILMAFNFVTISARASNDSGGVSLAIDELGPGIHVPIYHAHSRRSRSRQTRGLHGEGDDTHGEQVGLSDFMDVTYSVMINIGGTELSVVIDTGSSDLWVISDICASPDCTRTRYQDNFNRTKLQLYSQNSSLSGSNSSVPNSGFHSSSYPVSLFYGDSLTGTHAFGVIGTDTMEINSRGRPGLPILKPQYFAAIYDTNTSVLETGCVGLLGLGFPINSAMFLEVFEKDHPELDPESNLNHSDARKISTTHSPSPEVNYDKRPSTREQKDPSFAMQYLKRRTFPDLSKYAGGPSKATNSSASKSSSRQNTDKQQDVYRLDHAQETKRHRRIHDEVHHSSLHSSSQPMTNDTTSAPSSPSLWTPLLLSALNISGPPIWRIVTNAISNESSEQTTLKPMFSVSLQRDTNTRNNDDFTRGYDYGAHIDYDKGNPGILTIGGLPTGVSEDDLTWAEVRRYGVEDGGLRGGPGAEDEIYPITWEITIDDVYLDGRKLPRSTLVDPTIGVTGLIDTGNSLIRGPPDVIRYMKNLIHQEDFELDGEQGTEDNSTSTSCSISHTLAFKIGGNLFPIDPKDLVWIDEDSEAGQHCYLNIAPTDIPVRGKNGKGGGGGEYLYSWSLGDPFLKSVLASFYYGHTTHPSWDPPRIGLMSTVSQVAIESPKPHPDSPTTPDRGREREGAIPGVIQRPKLPLPAMLNAVPGSCTLC
ncbi:aspartic peptidase domain-containing protein [Lentinula detonsa]|uniref:Aspartic peptidase domain-containing protein n=1 Tax=Lentinula detonsa TaxID=2804962 RepID=A0A9W8NQ86_9AGAR|nr:aspartic peptidase domain-containing protein [Lentinula detonsa]